ncbi:Uncharacterized protein TCM_000873 [Theobroma cacao]|uniref:Uncharacterized protein n=1 Tax=Theobroma cacao TaxID=3641 RepID=A0A061DHC0_THECC|nr:Uncharacterized protein TCM_000873 [Theobroma cacao]
METCSFRAPLYLAPMRLTGEIPSSFICTSSELMLENENSEGKESHLLLHISRDGISCCFYAEWIISKSCDPSSFLTHGTYILSSV